MCFKFYVGGFSRTSVLNPGGGGCTGRNSGAEDGIAVSSDEVMMFACSGDNFHHGVGLADIAGAGWFLQTTCHRMIVGKRVD